MTPAGTSNELDVQNEWEENTHTHTSSLDVPAGVTQEEGHTGFPIHLLPSAVHAFVFGQWPKTAVPGAFLAKNGFT